MKGRILVTGGAGFIGGWVCRDLLENGYEVRALDNLLPQVHGRLRVARERPPYLPEDVDLQLGDVRDRDAVDRALDGVDGVIHLAAAVGVGQSMYQIEHYTSINNIGTAVLLEAMVENQRKRLVVASSMSLYGEGLYQAADGSIRDNVQRDREALKAGRWEPVDDLRQPLQPLPTPESKAPSLSSVYALSKFDQERLALTVAGAYQFPAVALRFFNVYGPHQALSNPYTGVMAIFAARYLNDNPPLIFEDGKQRRDFVNVRDVARAVRLAYESHVDGEVLNIGSGESITIKQVAEELARTLGVDRPEPEITGRYRAGDIRHCFADISRAAEQIGYRPEVAFSDGMAELVEWLAETGGAEDKVGEMTEELKTRGLAI